MKPTLLYTKKVNKKKTLFPPMTQEAEAGRSQVLGQPELCNDTQSQNNNNI